MGTRLLSLTIFVVLFTRPAAAWQAPQKLNPSDLTAEQRLKVLLASVAPYDLTLDKAAVPLKLYSNPLLRFDNSVGGVVDGVVLMWTDAGRPASLAQVFVTKDGYWLHEFQSMADRPLELQQAGKPRWSPKRAGAEFRPVAGAPTPDASRVGRLSQMKALARKFTVSEDFRARANDKETTKYELRMLPQPAYRYAESDVGADGAIFAFVHGTDPEAMLTIETQLLEKDQGWKFAWAPLTCWAVQARLDDREVWSVPEMYQKNSPNEPYHIWSFQPDPSSAGEPK